MISKQDQSRWQKVAFLCAICLHIYHILTDDYREITAILSFINRWTTYCKSKYNHVRPKFISDASFRKDNET